MEGDLLGLDLDPLAAPQAAQPTPQQQAPELIPAPEQAAPVLDVQPVAAPPSTVAATVTAADGGGEGTTTTAAVATTTTTNQTTTPTAAADDKKTEEKQSESKPEVQAAQKAKEEEEPTDPVLIEIKEKFGGKWKLARSDPYNEYLKAVGIGLVNRKLASSGTPEQNVEVKGDKIYIGIHSTFHNQNYVIKLNEEMENWVEKTRQSVFTSYADSKLTLQMTPQDEGFSKTQSVEMSISDQGELVLIYTALESVCRRYFTKVVIPPPVVG